MNNPAIVQVVQGPQAVSQGGLEGSQVHLSAGQSLGQSGLHQFHHQPAPFSVDVVDRDDVGVLQRCQQLGFLPVAVQLQSSAEELVADLLDGDLAAKFPVTGPVDGRIASGTDGFELFVSGFAGHRVGPQGNPPRIGRTIRLCPHRGHGGSEVNRIGPGSGPLQCCDRLPQLLVTAHVAGQARCAEIFGIEQFQQPVISL